MNNNDIDARLLGARVLLVEDNEINRMLMLDLLTDYGISVDVAKNGRDALSQLESIQVDIVLMDCQMPVMDGYTATRKMRELPGLKALPVIALTANSMANDREKVLAAGMNDYIAKPINIKHLLQTMAKWIANGAAPENRCSTLETDRRAAQITAISSDDEFSDLPGIDSDAGLAVVRGNIALYRKLLHKFREGFDDFEQQFRAACGEDDLGAAARTAHTLKGVASNIGARGLMDAAFLLEKACETGKSDTEQALNQVLTELRTVISGLRKLG